MTKSLRSVLALAVVALCFITARRASAQDFSIVLIPDPQNYSEFSTYGVYQHQMQWIVDNRVSKNIKFAVHLGDITNHNVAAEYQVASDAHFLLDDALQPYSMT